MSNRIRQKKPYTVGSVRSKLKFSSLVLSYAIAVSYTPAPPSDLIAHAIAIAVRRELDLLALDEDTPRLVGVRLEPVRLTVLLLAAALAATAVAAVGVVGFLGLVAPHVARALVGNRHVRLIPVSVLVVAVAIAISSWLALRLDVGRTLRIGED